MVEKSRLPLVSIVVPFFNPGAYFDELLDSLASQDYKNLEVVLVDDGSDELYSFVAKRFVDAGINRQVIRKDNGGVASARQVGVDAANGEYIIHADADDILPRSAISKLVHAALAMDSDIVIGGYTVLYRGRRKYIGVDSSFLASEFLEGLLLGRYHASLCNKLIRRSCYKGVRFESGINYMEDKLLLAKMLRGGNLRLGCLDESVYVYRLSSGSATMNMTPQTIEQSVAVVSKIVDLYANVLPKRVLDFLLARQRAFAIYQFAKNGINIFEISDLSLIGERKISLTYRVAIILSAFRSVFLIKWLHSIRRLL
ncbi:glycosyltransferase family 2 protein [Marinobacter sp.]|uniref:glycosyltransferase family 2 protein n=1 Tax=Marinobacter sp. TaxID=50741 RepID=UPI003A8F2266